MPPPAAIAGVPIFSAAGPTPMLTAPTMTSNGYAGSLRPGTAGQPAIAPSGVGIPGKLAHRIWRRECVEMFELLPEKLGQADSPPSTSKEKKMYKSGWPMSCRGRVLPHIRGGPGPNAASADPRPSGIRITGCTCSQEVSRAMGGQPMTGTSARRQQHTKGSSGET